MHSETAKLARHFAVAKAATNFAVPVILAVMHKTYKQVVLGFIIVCGLYGCEYKTEEIGRFESQLGCELNIEEVVSIAKKHGGTVRKENDSEKYMVQAVFNNKQEFLIYFQHNGKLATVNKREVYKLVFWYKSGAYEVTNECSA